MDLILGAPRRRWARGEKLAAVAATFSPGMTVTAVARKLGISRSMLFAWRKTLRLEAGFPGVLIRVWKESEPPGFGFGLGPAKLQERDAWKGSWPARDVIF